MCLVLCGCLTDLIHSLSLPSYYSGSCCVTQHTFRKSQRNILDRLSIHHRLTKTDSVSHSHSNQWKLTPFPLFDDANRFLRENSNRHHSLFSSRASCITVNITDNFDLYYLGLLTLVDLLSCLLPVLTHFRTPSLRISGLKIYAENSSQIRIKHTQSIHIQQESHIKTLCAEVISNVQKWFFSFNGCLKYY